MSNSISRATLMTLYCFSLSGCAVAIKSTSLEVAPPKPEETRLLNSVGYVFHDEIYFIRDKIYIESEKKSWVDALSDFTDKENIFTMLDGKPTSITNPAPEPVKTRSNALPGSINQQNTFPVPDGKPAGTMPVANPANTINSFAEFAKTHPIVHVYIKAIPEEKGLTKHDVIYVTPFIISFFSLGIIPAYLPIPYTASFTLSMPEETDAPPAHWEYSYDRREYYWLPVLFPISDYLASFTGEDETDTGIKPSEKRRAGIGWKTEEKRRLVLRFLQDAKPLLREH